MGDPRPGRRTAGERKERDGSSRSLGEERSDGSARSLSEERSDGSARSLSEERSDGSARSVSEERSDESKGTLTPLGAGPLAVAAAVGAMLASLAWLLLARLAGAAPAPVATGVVLLLLAAVVWWLARGTRQAVQGRRERLGVTDAVRRLGFARASLLGGAGLAGSFLFWALASVSSWSSPLGRDRLLWSVLAVAGSVALAWAGWLLQRALRVPPSNPDEDRPES